MAHWLFDKISVGVKPGPNQPSQKRSGIEKGLCLQRHFPLELNGTEEAGPLEGRLLGSEILQDQVILLCSYEQEWGAWGCLAGSAHRAHDCWSQSHEFKSHVGHRTYLMRKKTRKQRKEKTDPGGYSDVIRAPFLGRDGGSCLSSNSPEPQDMGPLSRALGLGSRGQSI